jgi:hypothetical protein
VTGVVNNTASLRGINVAAFLTFLAMDIACDYFTVATCAKSVEGNWGKYAFSKNIIIFIFISTFMSMSL